jgi:hypothetical protein
MSTSTRGMTDLAEVITNERDGLVDMLRKRMIIVLMRTASDMT